MSDLDSRAKILKAAMVEFAEKGKSGARMDTVAREAGVNKAMIYYYFSSKDQLFKAVLQEMLVEVMSVQRRMAALEGTIETKIDMIVEELVGLFRDRPNFLRLLIHEILEGTPHLPEIIRELSPDKTITQTTGIAPILQTAIDEGHIRGDDMVQVGVNIFSLCAFHSFFLPVVKLMWGLPELDEEAFLESRKRHIVELLRHGIFHNADSNE